MTCSSSSAAFGKKDKYVTWIKDSFHTLAEFYKYVNQLKIGGICTIDYAYETVQKRQFVIIGKVVALPPKLPNNRKVIWTKTVPATTLHIRELISDNDSFTFNKVFKVKFVGKIASDVESAGIHIGDRIVLINPLISENTDYLPSTSTDILTALMFDDGFGLPASVLLSSKIPPGAEFPKNKFLARLRCSTPVSDGKSELEGSESEAIENKAQTLDNKGSMNNRGKRIFKRHSRQISPKKNTPVKSGYFKLTNDQICHPALVDITADDNERPSPKKMNIKRRLDCSPIKSPAKQLNAVALNDDISIFEPCEGTSRNDNADIINSICQLKKKESVKHDFIKIKDISEKHINKKVNMFVIVLDVRQSEADGKKKRCLITRVIDETFPQLKPFTLFIYYEDRNPKVEPKWILRIRHVKIELYKGALDGRIFSAGSIVSFPPRCSKLEFEEPETLRKEPYEINDFDMNIVNNLRKYIIGKHWNLLVMLGGFYPNPPATIKQVTLEGITDETWFCLKCKIKYSRVFFDFNVIAMTVSDGTVLPHFSYLVPKECKLWSEALSSREKYFIDQKEIDIIMKNVNPAFDQEILKEKGEVLINNIQILRNKHQDLDALIFVLDASFPESKIDVLPSLADLNDFSETQQESNEITKSNEEYGKKTNTPSKECQKEVKTPSSHLHDGSKNYDDVIIVNEQREKINQDFQKPVVVKKKLFYLDSSNLDAYFSSSENTGDCPVKSRTKELRQCSIVLNKVPDSDPLKRGKNNTALSNDNTSGKNDLNSAEKIEKFKSPTKEKKTSPDNVEMQHMNSSDFTAEKESEDIQNSSKTSKEPLFEKPNDDSGDAIDHSRRNMLPDNGKYFQTNARSMLSDHGKVDQVDKIILMQHSSSSSSANLKKKGIKIPPNLQKLNLLPTLLIKRIDDSLHENRSDKRGSIENLDTDSSFSLLSSLLEGENLKFTNSDGSSMNQPCNKTLRKRKGKMKRNNCNSKENNASGSASSSSKISPDRYINSKVSVFKRRRINFGNDNLHNEGNNISSIINNYEVTEKEEGQSIAQQNKAFISDSLISSDINQNNSVKHSDDNNRVINNRKRKSSNQSEYSNEKESEQQSPLKIICQAKESSNHKINSKQPITLNESLNIMPFNFENSSLVHKEEEKHECFNKSNQLVYKKLKKSGKRRKRRGIEEIVRSLSESHLKLVSSSCECYSRNHKSNSCKDDSLSDMELTVYEGCSSVKSDCSGHINAATSVLGDCANRKIVLDGNITKVNQYDIQECSVLNCTSEKHSPSLSIYTVKNVLKTYTDEIKSSLKNKILARSSSMSNLEHSNLKAFKKNTSASVSPGSVTTIENLCSRERRLTNRKPIRLEGSDDEDDTMKKIREWFQRMETDGPSNVDELSSSSNVCIETRQNKEAKSDDNEHKELESQSQSISEFVKAETTGHPISRTHLPAVVIKKQLSYKVLMWDLQPKFADDPFVIISGFCENSCENFFLYSTLKYTSELTPICPMCFREGKEAPVKLNFLFELLLVLQTGHSITALVYSDHATKFLGCTVQEYLQSANVRQQTLRKLQYYLGAGHNLSMRYTPPFLAHLIPISLTPPNQQSAVRFCVIDTELPPVNSQTILSNFIDDT